MESGINADQNFYSRRPVAPPQASIQPHSYQQSYDRAALHDFQSRSPEVPPKLSFLTASNLQAIDANGFGGGLSGGGDPDAFYREYRGVQHSTQGYTEIASNGMPSTTEPRPPPSSFRSNGNGTTPKHPPVSGVRSNLKPLAANRSFSEPIKDRTGAGNAKAVPGLNNGLNGKQPSVKEMLKRFDPSPQPPSTTVRKPAPRIITKDSSTGGAGYMKDRVGYQGRSTGNTPTTSTSKAGVPTRDVGVKSPSNSRPTQRARFAVEDQHSNNTLSGVARNTRPKNGVAGNISQASKSMTNLSPTSPQHPTQTPAHRPLFGEVIASGQDSDVGYGIPHVATRRTSDSSLHPSWAHMRNQTSLDISPSSPTAWYLGVTPALEDVDTKSRSSLGHNRNHSDFADTKVNTMNGVNPSFSPPTVAAPSIPEPAKGSSRLPLPRKPAPELSNPASAHSSSTFTSRTLANGKSQKTEQRPWSPAGRTTTPTYQSSRTKARNLENNNNSSLKAIISAPPPITSPPLRSSRPRQTVSASTASSRQRVVDGSGSPQKARSGMKIARKSEEQATRQIDDVPVDFAARRATIKRAYTKSIQESEQKEIRAANLRRLEERKARDLEKERSDAQTNMEAQMSADSPQEPPREPPPEPLLETKTNTTQPLQISTSFYHVDSSVNVVDTDSPTLGIPGSFVDDDEVPASAISNATGTTDFDNEPQTEPAFMRLGSRPLSSQFIEWNQLSPEQASFGLNNLEHGEEGTIKMMLDASPATELPQEPTPTSDVFAKDPSPPGAFKRDSAYDKPIFATTVTSASPIETSPTDPVTHVIGDTHESSHTSDGESRMPGQFEIGYEPSHFPPSFEVSSTTEDDEPHTPDSNSVNPQDQTPLASTSLGMNNVHEYLNTPVTDMEYDSSDGYERRSSIGQDMYPVEYDPHPGAGATSRGSHQSMWTDCSLDTGDDWSEHGRYSNRSLHDSSKALGSAVAQLQQDLPIPDHSSTQTSPPLASETPRVASPPRHQLPPISTGEGFAFAFSNSASPILAESVLAPDETTPPPSVPSQLEDAGPVSQVQSTRSPPPLSFHNRRPPSSIYQSSQNGTSHNTESRRASDDTYDPRPSMSTTPRSSAQISVEEASISQSSTKKDEPLTEEEKAAAQKTKSLLEKRGNIIKELIETESVYLKDMSVVEEIYKGTAEACPKLGYGDVRAIFRNSDEIVDFSTRLLEDLKSAASSVYSTRSKARQSKATTGAAEDRFSVAVTLMEEAEEQRHARTSIGATFSKYLPEMEVVYTEFLKNQEPAMTRLEQLQTDPAVKVWLNECNTVAKDLTQAWDIGSLMVKPVQRLTRWKMLITELVKHTQDTHPDYLALKGAVATIGDILSGINDLKKRVQTIAKIAGRKRKESDVRLFPKVFGIIKRTEKPQQDDKRKGDSPSGANAPTIGDDEDQNYVTVHQKFGQDFLKLQIILRDVEFHIRTVTTNVDHFLKLLSSMELVMRSGPSSSPEIESKWVHYNMSMRTMGSIALEEHVSAVRKALIEPLEKLITTYEPPRHFIKKRAKRRLDYEKSVQLKAAGKSIDSKLAGLVEEYEALNETLKADLSQLSAKTQFIADICTSQLVMMQVQWYDIWQKKVRSVLEDSQIPRSIDELLEMFHRDYKYYKMAAKDLGIINGQFLQTAWELRTSLQGRPSNLSSRSRAQSTTSDNSPSLPTPEYFKRHSGQFSLPPVGVMPAAGPQFPPQTTSFTKGHSRNGSGSPATADGIVKTYSSASGTRQHPPNLPRPSTGRSFTSESGMQQISNDYNTQNRRESSSTHTSGYHVDGPLQSVRPFSGLFHSAMPLPDGPEDSHRSSRASSRDRNDSGRLHVLYLAASLFEFNIHATKQEAGYPYLTYSAGEIFDVVAQKGELWLAKNQDDPNEVIGWIWSKHFARLAE
ncbi:hypothetical protein B0O99DRAFT_680069 [Bisporella sp. PMI_857]|nr:hypothetical protein B0O99DRAFT_680069 [Bisporella sp. PMI_857]